MKIALPPLIFLWAIILSIGCSCITKGQKNTKNQQLFGEKLLNEKQLEKLSNVSRITLYDIAKDSQRSVLNRTLSVEEVDAFFPYLVNTKKDTSLVIDKSKKYTHKLEIVNGDYILSVFIYEGLQQLKLGDFQNGIIITGVDKSFTESFEKLIVDE